MQLTQQAVPVDPQRSRYAYYEYPPAEESTTSVGIALAGYEQTLAKYRIDRTDFPLVAIEFVTGGCGQLNLNGQSHSLSPGVAFAYGPGIPHSIASSHKAPLQKYFIDLYGHDLDTLIVDSGLPPGTVKQNIECTRIGALIDALLADSEKSQNDPLIVAHTVRLILRLSGRATTDGQQGSAYETYRRARQRIEMRYSERIGIAEIANDIHCAPAYLSRLFRRYSGETPVACLNRLRMSRAALLLLHHNLPVQEVAESVGFSDPFHFSTRFKAFHGRSPSEFRQIVAP